jgi:hypothetical protein
MSGYVSIKVLQESINITEVEKEARATWEREHRKRRRVEQWIIRLLPFGLILMTMIFYGLSAPHTAALMSLITPTFVGQYLAPLGFELGILIIAALLEAGMRSRAAHLVLWVLLILSIVINIAGAFIAVVSLATGVVLEADTVDQLLQRFTSLPATYQVVLILVPFIGAAIPIVAKLSGEVVVKIALGKIRLERESDESLWAKESAKVMHGALLQAAMKLGAGVKTAGNWAASVAEQMYAYRVPEPTGSTAKAVGKPFNVSSDQPARAMGFLAQRTIPGQSQPDFLSAENLNSENDYVEKDTPDIKMPRLSKNHVAQWLTDHPEYHLRADRDVSRAYMLDTFGIDSESGYKTVQRAKKDIGL